MSGKTKNNNKWGGTREGAGRPKYLSAKISDETKLKWVEAAESLAKKYGKTVEKAALEMIYDEKVMGTVKASVLKAYNEALLVKTVEKAGPQQKNKEEPFELPDLKPDPAKEIQKVH